MNTTPRWVEDSFIGTGSYDFSYGPHFIEAESHDALDIEEDITLSAWIRYNGDF